MRLTFWDPEIEPQGPPLSEMAAYDPNRSYPNLVEPDGTMRSLNHLFSRVTGFLVYDLHREAEMYPGLKGPTDEERQTHVGLLAE